MKPQTVKRDDRFMLGLAVSAQSNSGDNAVLIGHRETVSAMRRRPDCAQIKQ